jgi:hypothetical protein
MRRRLMLMASSLAPGAAQTERPADPIVEAFAARRDFDQEYLRILQNILTPHQFNQLPSAQRIRVPTGGVRGGR